MMHVIKSSTYVQMWLACFPKVVNIMSKIFCQEVVGMLSVSSQHMLKSTSMLLINILTHGIL